MKLKINTKIISSLYPCEDRFENWKQHYGELSIDALEFLELDQITFSDKIWVLLRLVPRDLLITFAFDCGIKAQQVHFDPNNDATAAHFAADVAYYSAYYSANYSANFAANSIADTACYSAHFAAYQPAAYFAPDVVFLEKSYQDSLDALAYLIKGWDVKSDG